MPHDIKPYDPRLGTPNRRPVSAYSPASSRDLPKSWEEARDAYARAMQRRGGAKGKLTYNTWIVEREIADPQTVGRINPRATVAYAVRLHDTNVVTFYPDGSAELDCDNWQSPTTRDRWNRCGFCVGMGSGVPYLSLGEGLHMRNVPYVDGMKLCRDGSEWAVSYPQGRMPVGTWQDIKSRRTRLLAKARRVDARAQAGKPREYLPVQPWYWDHHQGGRAYRGTVPEAFHTDSECGLSARTGRR